jgi:hypothetical protein
MEQSPEWDIVVVGGAYTDYVVRGPELPGLPCVHMLAGIAVYNLDNHCSQWH